MAAAVAAVVSRETTIQDMIHDDFFFRSDNYSIFGRRRRLATTRLWLLSLTRCLAVALFTTFHHQFFFWIWLRNIFQLLRDGRHKTKKKFFSTRFMLRIFILCPIRVDVKCVCWLKIKKKTFFHSRLRWSLTEQFHFIRYGTNLII